LCTGLAVLLGGWEVWTEDLLRVRQLKRLACAEEAEDAVRFLGGATGVTEELQASSASSNLCPAAEAAALNSASAACSSSSPHPIAYDSCLALLPLLAEAADGKMAPGHAHKPPPGQQPG